MASKGLHKLPFTSASSQPARHFNITTDDAEESITVIYNDDYEPPLSTAPQTKTNDNNIKKNAWYWKYFDVKVLDKKFSKGKTGHKQMEALDELYKCNIQKNCPFSRYASKLYTSSTALKDHIVVAHGVHKDTDEKLVRFGNPTTLDNWLDAEDDPSFEDALLDWIVYECEPFVCTESRWFRRMLSAGGCKSKVPGADTVKNRLTGRVSNVERDNTKLFADKSSTVAVSLDGWTSQNNYSVIAINVSFLSPNFEVYKRCIEFIEIEGSHSGENLARIVEHALNKHGLLQKLLSITADNASNNGTLCRYLYSSMARKYDNHLEEFPSREGTMRFKGEDSQNRCFGHILNPVVKAILQDLGSSTHKDAVAFLDRASEHLAKKCWRKITIPGATGVIAKLRLIVLWTDRSAQRQQEWDRRSKKQVNYDVDTRWNCTLRMINDALDCKAALSDTVDDHLELADPELSSEDWHQLEVICDLLTPFGEYTEFISREQPTLQMSARVYLELQSLLTKASKLQAQFQNLDHNLVHAVKASIDKFNDFVDIMKGNDIYFLATLLDPRVKTQWIKDNLDDADVVTTRLRFSKIRTITRSNTLCRRKQPQQKPRISVP